MRKMMRRTYGLADEVLVITQDAAKPGESLGEGQVLVKVVATAVSPADYRLVEGWLRLVIEEKMPAGLGLEFSGVVTESASERFGAGDEVFGELEAESSGTFADYCVASEANVALKPRNLSHAEAAALPVAAVALGAVKPYERLLEKRRVLVLGGSAATGAYICQLCRNVFRAKYLAATSSNVDFCLRNGCDRVFDYKRGELWWHDDDDDDEEEKTSSLMKEQPSCTSTTNAVAPFDVVFDCVGGDSWRDAREHLPPTAQFVTFVPMADGEVTITGALSTLAFAAARSAAASMGLHCQWSMVMAEPDAEALAAVAHYVRDGKLKPVIDSTYDFTLPNVIDMIQRQKLKQVRGRQICTVHTEAEALEGLGSFFHRQQSR